MKAAGRQTGQICTHPATISPVPFSCPGMGRSASRSTTAEILKTAQGKPGEQTEAQFSTASETVFGWRSESRNSRTWMKLSSMLLDTVMFALCDRIAPRLLNEMEIIWSFFGGQGVELIFPAAGGRLGARRLEVRTCDNGILRTLFIPSSAYPPLRHWPMVPGRGSSLSARSRLPSTKRRSTQGGNRHAENIFRQPAMRHRKAFLQQRGDPLLTQPLAPAGQRRAIKRQVVPEHHLAAEILKIRVLDPPVAQCLVREIVHVLEDEQSGYQSCRQRWQPRPKATDRSYTKRPARESQSISAARRTSGWRRLIETNHPDDRRAGTLRKRVG